MNHLGSAAEQLARLQAGRVLVVGDALVDRMVSGKVARISPEAPVPVLHQESVTTVVGGAANVAANLASLGASVTLLARRGADDAGRQLVELLQGLGVGHVLWEDHAVPTVTKTRFMAAGQQLVRVDHEVPTPAGGDGAVWTQARLEELLVPDRCDAVVVADYAKGFVTDDLLRAVVDRGASLGLPVVCDPKGRDLGRYRGCTVVKPNLLEARLALGAGEEAGASPEARAELAVECLSASGAQHVVLSCGAHGAVVVGQHQRQPCHIPALALEVADPTGAGDTLVAVLALAIGAGVPLRRAVELATSAAGAVCTRVGTVTLDPTELLAILGKVGADQADNPKILGNQAQAAAVGAEFAGAGRSLVLANGCFDLLHAGHLRLLQEARRQGDALLVAVNSDASVSRLKGVGRPLQTERDRCAVMAALECVDYVVVFDEDTPLELIEAVRPAVLVKGDDYRVEEIAGAREVVSWGGRVVLVERVPDLSTSSLAARAVAAGP